jgi:triacylglycerol lipase
MARDFSISQPADHAAPEAPPKSGVRSSRLRSLEVAGREAFALAKQSTLFYRDVLEVVPQARPGDDVVVFVHGLFQTAGVLRPVRQRIALETRAETASFSYATGPGVVRIAERLAELMRDLPRDIRIHLVGHSVGGLVVRWYVQELGRDERVVQTISLGTPFSGTTHARYFPTQVGRDIVPNSRLLSRLAAGARAGERVPHLSITATHDSVVPSGAVLAAGDTLRIHDCGHNGLIYHGAVAREIVRRVRTIQAAAELCAGF